MEQTLTTTLPKDLKNWLSQPIPSNLTEDEEEDFLIDSFFDNFKFENINPNEDEKLLEMML